MAASRIKGITVEIGGDTTGLDKALSGVNKKINTTQSELRDVEKLLKLDPTNTVLLGQKQELLAKAISDTEDKLGSLKKANEQAAESVKKYDAWKAAYDPIQKEIGDTQKLLTELKDAQKEALDIQGADSDEYKKLQDDISETTKQLKELKQQAKAVSEEFGNPISQSQYNSLQREIVDTEMSLKDLKGQAEKVEKAVNGIDDKSLDEVADAADNAEKQLKEAGKEASNFGDYLKAGAIIEGAKGIVSGLKDVAEESKEYMKIMGSLEVSSQNAGYSAEETSDTYKKLYGVLADEQSAATTTANLQALELEQEKIMELTNASIGAWSKYGDSIPIDGLAEAINETVKAGQVTGAFADVLNWGAKEGETYGVKMKEATEENEAWNQAVADAATAEDFFNLALQDAATEAERANLILQALADQGLTEAGNAWQQNNEALVENNQANAELQEQMAQLGETVMPIITDITELVAGFLEKFNALDEGTQGFILGAIALVAVLGPVLSGIGGIATGIGGLSGSLGTLSTTVLPGVQNTFSSVFGFIAANPIVLLIAAIVGLVALIATKGDEIQKILQKVDDFFQNIFAKDWTEVFGPVLGNVLNGFFANVKNIWDSAMQIFNGVIDFVRGVFTGDWERAWSGVTQIFEGIFKGLVANAKAPINGIIGLLNGAIGAVNGLIEGFNGIGFDLPDFLGGGSWHPNIPTIPEIPFLWNGGTVVDGGTVLVGEKGPELLDLPTGARVRPLGYDGSTLSRNDVYEAMKQAFEEVGIKLEVEADKNNLFKVVRASNQEWKNQHGGVSAFE